MNVLHEITVYTVGYERAGRIENRYFGEIKSAALLWFLSSLHAVSV